LKAFLFLHDIEPPKIHDLNELMEMCTRINSNFSVLLPQLDILRVYAVLPRYPNELDITEEDMKTAIKYAKIVQEHVLKTINIVDGEKGTGPQNSIT
jgi:HEPN domain-containing protein